MKTNQKIIVDRIIGVVIAIPLNYLVRFIGFITRFDHSLVRPKERIVICKFKGMGSIIQATPLIATLKEKYPTAKIVFVSSIENKMIVDEIAWIDEALYIKDSGVFKLFGSSIRLIFNLLKNRADLYIDLEIYSNFSSIIATFSMATDRFGYYLKSSRYRLGMYTHMMYFNTTAPISEVYLQFARLLGCNELVHSPYPFTKDHRITEDYFVINANASDLRIERRWPKESFIALIKALRIAYPNYAIQLIGAKSEAAYVETIATHFKEDDKVIDVSGKTSLKELIQTIAHATIVITNDTGPMHLAAAMSKQTVALFGPCSPNQYAIGDTIFPIYKNVYCSPCVHEFLVPPCKGNNSCMQLIEVMEVLTAVKQLYSKEEVLQYHDSKIFEVNDVRVLGTVVRD